MKVYYSLNTRVMNILCLTQIGRKGIRLLWRGSKMNLIVTNLDTIELLGADHRRWEFTCPAQDEFTTTFIEGIGGEFGLDEPVFSIFWEGAGRLHCFKRNGVTVYGGCSLCTVPVELTSSERSFLLFPNPANDFFIANISDYWLENPECKIFSAEGKCVKQIQLKKGHNVVDLEGIPSGVYCISIYDGSRYEEDMLIIEF